MLKRIIRKLVENMAANWYNPFLSLIVNFYYLPFRQARCLPIACYGWPRFISMHGKIRIESDKIYAKMIRLNTTRHNSYHGGVVCRLLTMVEYWCFMEK